MTRESRGWALDLDRGGLRLALVCHAQDGEATVQLLETTKLDREPIVITKDPNLGLKVAFSLAGQRLACDRREDVELWDVTRSPARRMATLTGFPAGVAALAFTPDGKTLAAGGYQGGVKVWSLAEDKPRELGVPEEQNLPNIAVLAYSPDGKVLAVGERNGTVRLWSSGGRELKAKATFKGLGSSVQVLAFSPDGKKLAAAGYDGHAVVWNTTGETLHQWRFPWTIDCVAFAPDNRHLALAHRNATVSILRLPK
jgi:WD40 repeat protein